MIRLLPPFLSAFLLAAVAGAAEWPTYRRDNARTAATDEALQTPLVPRWVAAPPALPRTAWSSAEGRVIEGKLLGHRVKFDDAFHVAVAGGRVYFGSSVDHSLHCKSLETGTEVWRYVTGGPIRLAPTVWRDRVLFGSDDGYVYCLNAADGKVVWKRRAGPDEEWILARGEMISRWPVRTGILIDGDLAWFGAGIFPHENIFLYAVKADDGAIVWKRDNISQTDAGRDDLSPQGYLLAEGERLFVPSGRSLPAAFEKATGKMLYKRVYGWRNTAGGVVGGTKALLADGQIYSGGPHHFLAMDQKNGNVGFGWFAGRQMAVAGDAAYVATGEAVARLDRLAYAEASRARHELELKIDSLSQQLRSAAGEKADEIRAQLEDARKQLAESKNAGVLWTRETEDDRALTVAGKLVFVGGKDHVVALDTKTGEELWRADVEGEARGLAVAQQHLLVSTSQGKVYCFASADFEGGETAAAAELVQNPYPKDKLTGVYRAAAKQILERTDTRQGFCLVVGSENGRLAYEVAQRSNLKVYCIEPDEAKVAASRKALTAAGLYGNRVVVHHADPTDIVYSNYFANLIVSDTLVSQGTLPAAPEAIARHLKPCGGVVCLGRPENAPGEGPKTDEMLAWLEKMQLKDTGHVQTELPWVTLTRGKLPGAGSWTHQYGEPGNTAVSDEQRVKGGLGVLWYGDPGPGMMVNRHEGAVGPLAANGRLFVQGEHSVAAYDAYNGQFLWEREDPEAIRTGVFQNENPGNLAASDDSLFVMIGDKCFEYDAATGEVRRTHLLPPEKRDAGTHQWGYVAQHGGLLYGTATVRKELEARLRRRGRRTDDATDMIFAIDLAAGEHLWAYQGQSISHHTIALGPQRAYFIDSTITSEQRQAILEQDKTELAKLTGEEAKIAEERQKRIDARLAVALDARTGEKLWEQPVDVTDCSEIGIGGGKLTLMYKDGVLILGGANANGHYWRQFVAGDFSRRRLVALSAADGQKLWAIDANYRHRPIIVGGKVIAEPWAFDLKTGEQQMRAHPLTGLDVPWSLIRPGHHCGMISGCENMLFFRSGYTGFYDLQADSGTRHFAGHRLGCWINAIPANGLVSIPEASAGCVCLFSIASTIVMEPREPRRPWAIYSATGAATPVAHMALNFGAPGDRRDARGTLWLAYPRPAPYKVTGLDLPLDIGPKFLSGGGYEGLDAPTHPVAGTESPWLYTTYARGLHSCSIPLLGKDDAPAIYTVKLHFADLAADCAPGERVFDVKLQGALVLENFDIAAAAGEGNTPKALFREIQDVEVTDHLHLELLPKGDSPAEPILSAIEIKRVERGGEE